MCISQMNLFSEFFQVSFYIFALFSFSSSPMKWFFGGKANNNTFCLNACAKNFILNWNSLTDGTILDVQIQVPTEF